MGFWKSILFRKDGPRGLRLRLSDSEDKTLWDRGLSLPLLRFLLILLLAILLLALFQSLFGGSLVLEKRKTRQLAHQVQELTRQASRLHTLERQGEESALLLLRMENMLGQDHVLPDSLLSEEARETFTREGVPDSPLASEGQQIIRSMPSAWPLRGWITREFEGIKGQGFHPGIDIAAEEGSPIRAAGDGVVLIAGWNSEYGNFVLIEHGIGISTLYGHGSRLAVSKDDRVRRGDVVAFVGSTGSSTAPHLHYEVRRHGLPENPKKYLLD